MTELRDRLWRHRLVVGGVVGATALAVVAGAVLLPSATIRITPTVTQVGPVVVTLELEPSGIERGRLRAEATGSATGERIELLPASGTVVFYGWRMSGPVEVPAGTQVAAGQIVFATGAGVIVPPAHVAFEELIPGTAEAAITAVTLGAAGNVAAGSVDTVLDAALRTALGARAGVDVVGNLEATSGGADVPHPVILAEDVEAARAALEADLLAQLTDRLSGDADRLYPALPPEAVVIDVPDDLVGAEDQPTFSLDGELSFERAYVLRDAMLAAAATYVAGDPDLIPDGTTPVPDSVEAGVRAAALRGDRISVQVTLHAARRSEIVLDQVRTRVAGLTPAEAAAALADVGAIEVELWPGWVDRIPSLAIRVGVEVIEPETESPS